MMAVGSMQRIQYLIDLRPSSFPYIPQTVLYGVLGHNSQGLRFKLLLMQRVESCAQEDLRDAMT
jgi:hypothetical protein